MAPNGRGDRLLESLNLGHRWTYEPGPLFDLMVPEVGIEPTRTQGPEDFESSASTNFTTPADFYDDLTK